MAEDSILEGVVKCDWTPPDWIVDGVRLGEIQDHGRLWLDDAADFAKLDGIVLPGDTVPRELRLARAIGTKGAYVMRGLPKQDGGPMRRDMDLVLKILEHTERRIERDMAKVEIEGYDEEVVSQHVDMLYNSGYLVGYPFSAAGNHQTKVAVCDLTWEGHEFLAVLRNVHGWPALKKKLLPADISTIPLKMIQEGATAMVKVWLFQKLGLPG
jgi:hypothetical protein